MEEDLTTAISPQVGEKKDATQLDIGPVPKINNAPEEIDRRNQLSQENHGRLSLNERKLQMKTKSATENVMDNVQSDSTVTTVQEIEKGYETLELACDDDISPMPSSPVIITDAKKIILTGVANSGLNSDSNNTLKLMPETLNPVSTASSDIGVLLTPSIVTRTDDVGGELVLPLIKIVRLGEKSKLVVSTSLPVPKCFVRCKVLKS